jgi:hypothetical protein
MESSGNYLRSYDARTPIPQSDLDEAGFSCEGPSRPRNEDIGVLFRLQNLALGCFSSLEANLITYLRDINFSSCRPFVFTGTVNTILLSLSGGTR